MQTQQYCNCLSKSPAMEELDVNDNELDNLEVSGCSKLVRMTALTIDLQPISHAKVSGESSRPFTRKYSRQVICTLQYRREGEERDSENFGRTSQDQEMGRKILHRAT